jgi:hypothetical protein
MDAIEAITSQKVEVTVKRENSEVKRLVPVWNATVANLTLMAMGSSAPEILLAIFGVVGSLGACP